MSGIVLQDQRHRDMALDTSLSCIVQAPAGSGKTELLTLRYLNLLALVEEPEEILAITFTRKAAAEMRNRIISTLDWAQNLSQQDADNISEDLIRQRYQIARKALASNEARDWQILSNPTRLRIQTIDAFCLYLSRQLPIQSSLGGSANISEDMNECFTQAARATLMAMNQQGELADSICHLLSHLDNDLNKVERLLIDLLQNRDQWSSYILELKSSLEDAREYLQHNLQELIDESVEEAGNLLAEHEAEIVELRNFSGSILEGGKDFFGISELPDSSTEGMAQWRAIASMLLTKEKLFRKTVDKRCGFPASDADNPEINALCKPMKAKIIALLELFKGDLELEEALRYLLLLPDPAYGQQQWEFLSALTQVLSYLNQQLMLSFRNFRVIDYVQAGAAANSALGSGDAPSDLALALDHKISHILVDEFQDTSSLQLDLLSKLSEGWEVDDGRTLFVVGDAMQSCYSFRNANVGIYLDVRERGIGQVKLKPLTLQSNFRSQQHIVNWVNGIFSSAFPARANSSRGAVPYTDSVPSIPALDSKLAHATVNTELISHAAEQRSQAKQLEAKRLVETIKSIQAQELKCKEPNARANPDKPSEPASIAVLVRNRSHLRELIPALRDAGILWQSTEIDRLDSLPVIEDLLSLLRAILNLADRIAWQSVLRAPYCGLKLEDLLAIELHCQTSDNPIIFLALQHYSNIESLSDDGKERLQDVVKVLQLAMQMRFHFSLSHILKFVWKLCGGDFLSDSDQQKASIDCFFELLDEQEEGFGLKDIDEFQERVFKAFIPSGISEKEQQKPDEFIQILTIHKAKGLEFDHVIIPGLNNRTRSDSKDLINWHERLNHQGQKKLFIGALSASGKDDDPLYSLIRHEKQQRTLLEDTRLLYIAITRAKTSVTLLATLELNSKGEVAPYKNSLLRRIWDEIQTQDQSLVRRIDISNPEDSGDAEAASELPAPAPADQNQRPLLNRLRDPLSLNSRQLEIMQELAAALEPENDAVADDIAVEEISQSTTDLISARSGTLIHQALQAHVESPLTTEILQPLRRHWKVQLARLVDDDGELTRVLDSMEKNLLNCINDEANNWIFDSQLEDSSTELEITRQAQNYVENYIIDRSFVDESGTRWIIDYKTASKQTGEADESFIARQRELHGSQLENYRSLFANLEERATKTALYLSSIPALIELN